MTTPSVRDLVGLQFSVTHHAGNMRGFHFGKIARDDRGVAGEYALHVKCPWRIETDQGILTGLHDWYEFVGGEEPEDWEPARGGSVQELRLRELFACPVEVDRAIVNHTGILVVTGIEMDPYGGLRIVLDRFSLIIFPCASVGEHWRLFRVDDDESPHLVVEGERSPINY